MRLGDLLLSDPLDGPLPPSSLSGTDLLHYQEQHVFRRLFSDLQKQASSRESQLLHALEYLGRDNQVHRIQCNEAKNEAQGLQEALRASEIRTATLADQLESERLEHRATREALQFEQLQREVAARELPPLATEDVLLRQVSKLSELVDHIKNQQDTLIKESLLARDMLVRSHRDIGHCIVRRTTSS